MLNIIKYQEMKMNTIMFYGPTPDRKAYNEALVIASVWEKRNPCLLMVEKQIYKSHWESLKDVPHTAKNKIPHLWAGQSLIP